MAENMDKIIVLGLVLLAAVAAWAVITSNHLFIG